MSDAGKTFHAVHRWARIAPRKARLVADVVRGLAVNDAIAVLEQSPKRAARLVRKVLRSAMANASQHVEVDLNALVVRESRVDAGPLLGGRARWQPRAQGRACPIHKRTSHIHIRLGESVEAGRRRKRGGPASAAPEGAEAVPAAGE